MIGIAIATMDGLTKAVWNISDFAVPSAKAQNPLGNGRIWGHPKPRQGGFVPWTPKHYHLSCFCTRLILMVVLVRASRLIRRSLYRYICCIGVWKSNTHTCSESDKIVVAWPFFECSINKFFQSSSVR